MEKVIDLLSDSEVNLKLMEDLRRGVFVDGLYEEIILDIKDL